MAFDFKEHARDESIQSQFNELMDTVEEVGDLRERFRNLRHRHRINNRENAAPNFYFTLNPILYNDVVRHCSENGINLRRVILIQADKFFVARNYELNPDNQTYDLIASSATVDIHHESSMLSFLDDRKTIVDFAETLNNLNQMTLSKPYSKAIMKTCLLRFVSHYESAQTEYLRNNTSDGIANFLLSLNTRVDKIAYHKSKLLSAVRKPDETLSSAVQKVRRIAEQIYAPTPDPAVSVDPAVPAVPAVPLAVVPPVVVAVP